MAFIGEKVPTRFFYYSLEEDMVLLRQLIAPKNITDFPHRIWDIHGHNIAQEFQRLGMPRKETRPVRTGSHNALSDALWAQKFLQNLRAYEQTLQKTPQYQSPTI